ncbi:TlpA disulfide reductase family protein [Dysgonomonas sp. ZJ709]|uniref:TlpA family protein disulfide reductase n=1 Tax=Dysgonomonas sp. ZJ709 TaxID=2709797 RepID=UPI0013EBB2C9|nr:TlpA disulfide reductase family protein [Dysgonomonas sp. ZJ709]
MNYILAFLRNNLKSISYGISIGRNRLKIIYFTIIGGLFFCISGALSQNTAIVFNTKENVTFDIGKEIDNTFSLRLTNQINVDATGSYIYNWDVHDFQFVDCSFYDGGSIFFPIKQGSHLTITYKGDNQIEISGTDKAEVEFYIGNYKKGIIQPFIGSLFSFPPESSFEALSLLIEEHYSILSNTLDSLVSENTISPKFSDILKNEFHTIATCVGIEIYRTRYLENAATKVNEQDSIKVEGIINGILDEISPIIDSGDILKYNLGRSSLAVFYNNKYRCLNEKEKEKLFLRNKWANSLEANRLGYLIAPEEVLYKLLSLELLDNYANGVTKGNSALFSYISEIRPQNAFLPYLKEKQNELLASINTDYSEIKYVESVINTLEDLNKVDYFDQKILYIDLWATWCGPCIVEFKHKDKLHELLQHYKDIIPVYISLDEDKNDIIWSEKTKVFNLKGYHLRANKELTTDINEKLFGGRGIGVPHYILLDKDGNILEKNLSRPSKIDKLKQELDKHFD